MWVFLLLNLAAFATAHLHPVAPPWYVDAHGFAVPDASVRADPAGCRRVDDLLGVGLFAAFYCRSVDPFGAVPSLHVGYPMLAVYYAFQFGGARIVSLAAFLLTCFSAVYLNHHYVIDLVAGAAYALLVAVAVDLVLARSARRGSSGGAPPP